MTDAEWQALYRRLERPLYNLAYRYLWNRDEAQDAVQEAFLQVWSRRAQLLSETADRYLWVSVLNQARKRRRWRRLWSVFDARHDAVAELVEPVRTELLVERQQNDALLRRALDALPENLRGVLLLTEFSDMSYADIAHELRIPVGTVGSRRHLAIKRLRDTLPSGVLP